MNMNHIVQLGEKSMLKKIFITTFFIALCFLVTVHAQQKKVNIPAAMAKLNCQDCHACKNPTVSNPCLRMCPRHWKGKDIGHKLTVERGPHVVFLKELENLYAPVKFDHKSHAYWSDMSGGCITCHHYTPTDVSHPSCSECHGPNAVRENIEPSLKGAYHQQCMGCHMEWSKDTNCEVCHALKVKKPSSVSAPAIPSYRPAKKPDKNIYKTDYDDAPFVTFFHNNHSEIYGFTCTDCHQDQSCVVCHYQTEKPVSDEDVHGKCSTCHDVDDDNNCSKCHSKTEKKIFNHGKATGWVLNIYHQKLSCRSCHPAGKPISKLNKTCNNCHKKWDSENFNHAIVGLALDENHIDADCSDCHVNRQFDKKPDCSSCHEGEKTYPKDKPGEVTKKRK